MRHALPLKPKKVTNVPKPKLETIEQTYKPYEKREKVLNIGGKKKRIRLRSKNSNGDLTRFVTVQGSEATIQLPLLEFNSKSGFTETKPKIPLKLKLLST